jgi:TolB protein
MAPNRSILLLALYAGSSGLTQTPDLGVFTNAGSVGKTPPGCAARYDTAKGEYRITGGGANIWYASDAFYFVWKEMTGDLTLSADVEWVGSSAVGHRKAVLMVRQNLDPGRPMPMPSLTATD